LNVLYDHQIFQAQRFGGVSRYFFELIRRMVRMPNVGVSLFQGLHINQYDLEKSRSEYDSFFGARRLPVKGGMFFSAINQVLFRGFASRSRATIYHPTYYGDPYSQSRLKRILTVHDMIHELFPGNFPGDRTAEQKRHAVKKADEIIAVSDATKRDLIRVLGTPPDKIHVVYHGNPLRVLPDNANPPSAPYFLFVGIRKGYKNFDRVLEAFAISSRLKMDFQLHCFGGPPLTIEEQRKIQILGLGQRVTHSSGPDAVLASRYSNAVALIYPSLYEGFGLPVLEAMHYGCPVLCANTSSLPEVAGDAARFFEPRGIDSIIEAMEDIAYNSAKRKALLSAGYIQEKKFSWDQCVEQTMAVYET
jgi:glycosyltransferase involved in cell wall biosynthesis